VVNCYSRVFYVFFTAISSYRNPSKKLNIKFLYNLRMVDLIPHILVFVLRRIHRFKRIAFKIE